MCAAVQRPARRHHHQTPLQRLVIMLLMMMTLLLLLLGLGLPSAARACPCERKAGSLPRVRPHSQWMVTGHLMGKKSSEGSALYAKMAAERGVAESLGARVESSLRRLSRSGDATQPGLSAASRAVGTPARRLSTKRDNNGSRAGNISGEPRVREKLRITRREAMTAAKVMQASFQRSNSHDKVRRIVAEEGRTARNLIAWSVPLESRDEEGSLPHIVICAPVLQITRRTFRPYYLQAKKLLGGGGGGGVGGGGISEKIPCKPRPPSKADLRARYWAYLFDNLRRAVDEIYVTCETDQSVVECKEVLMMLDNYVRDFKSLIDWLHLQEKLEKTDVLDRPTSLAWEVRKMSPGRHVAPSPPPDRITSVTGTKRKLTFPAAPVHNSVGSSWADKVRASQPGAAQAPKPGTDPKAGGPERTQQPQESASAADGDGWEMVQRGRPSKSRSATALAKAASGNASANGGGGGGGGAASVPTTNAPPPAGGPPGGGAGKANASAASRRDVGNKENRDVAPRSARPNAGCVGGGGAGGAKATVRPCLFWTFCPRSVAPVVPSASRRRAAHSHSVSERRTDADIPKLFMKPLQVVRTAGGSPCPAAERNARRSMAAVLAEEEELACRLERENEEAIANAIAEEEQLTREILDEQDLDTAGETDTESELSAGTTTMSSLSLPFNLEGPLSNMDWNDIMAEYEARESWRQTTSWGDMVEDEPPRPPGHAIQMHEKLSSPSRKRTIAESKRKHEEKQLKAQQIREKLREENSLKLQKLMERVKEVRKWKEELLEQKRRIMEEKLLRAEYQRELQLQAIVKKAQEEEAKVNEIAFINTLEAQNRRHDALCKLKEYEVRLNELRDERHRRQEEKQARDEAVQERKRALEAERLARVEELLLKRREQQARIEQQRQEKERAREDAARERARDREERLAALNAAQQEAMEELQKKIQLKHDESVRRHMEQMEQRKEKAAELSSGRHAAVDVPPKLTPYERKKQCTLCSVWILSEVYLYSHIRGKRHAQAVREHSSITGRELSDEEVEHLSLRRYVVEAALDAPDPACPSAERVRDEEERLKAKKRAKKLRARMNSRAKEFEASLDGKVQVPESAYKAKLQRLVKDINKQLQSHESGPWPNNKVLALDRALGELMRIMEKQNPADQVAFQLSGGFESLGQILQVIASASSPNTITRIPFKSLCLAANAYCLACRDCADNCHYVLYSNKIVALIDLLLHHLAVLIPVGDDAGGDGASGSVNRQVFEGPSGSLLRACGAVIDGVARSIASAAAGGSDGSRPATPRKTPAGGGGGGGGGKEARLSSSCSSLSSCSGASTGHREGMCGRASDLVSYMVHAGVAEKLCRCLRSVQGSVDDQPRTSAFLAHAVHLLRASCTLARLVAPRSQSPFDTRRPDGTGLASVLRLTEAAGVLNLLYCTLLHGAAPDRDAAAPAGTGAAAPPAATTAASSVRAPAQDGYPAHTLGVALEGVRLLNSFAFLDLAAFQEVVGSEGLSLAFRHIASSLLWYCSHHACTELLHAVIVCVGYFTVNNADNQTIVQSGRQPTVLQQLCLLPFQYFSEARLRRVLFPTLLSACHRSPVNRSTLQTELSCTLLTAFIQVRRHTGGEDDLDVYSRFPQEQWEGALRFFSDGAGDAASGDPASGGGGVGAPPHCER
ncbi:unnamed protein product [Lampetra fluviatilis]